MRVARTNKGESHARARELGGDPNRTGSDLDLKIWTSRRQGFAPESPDAKMCRQKRAAVAPVAALDCPAPAAPPLTSIPSPVARGGGYAQIVNAPEARAARSRRDARIVTRARDGQPVRSIAELEGISRSQTYRVLQRESSRRQPPPPRSIDQLPRPRRRRYPRYPR